MRGGVTAGIVLAALSFAPAAGAATFTVDTKKDLLDANQVDGICAAANGKCSVRAATMAANGNPGADTITIPEGVFELTQPGGAPSVHSSLEGDLDLDETVTISGAGRNKTIIRQTVNDRVILSNAEPTSATISDLTITGGRLTKPANQLGGGIYVESNGLNIQRVVVKENLVSPTTSANSFGGGIAVNGGFMAMSKSTVKDNAVKLRSETASAVGGGVFVDGVPGGTAIVDSRIEDNIATVNGGGRGTGGGLFARSPVTVARGEISGNRAQEGGGITFTSFLGSGSVSSTSIVGNRAVKGGGVLVNTDDPVTITNSTIARNEIAKGPERGGAAIYSDFGDITLRHLTIAGNKAGKRKTLKFAPFMAGVLQVDLTGSIVDGPRKDCGGAENFDARSQNVFGDSSCNPVLLSTNVVADPLLKPLADNPGLNAESVYGPTFLLKGSSPAVGFVTSGCPPPSTDQLGFTRSAGACEAGAVEKQ